MSLFCKCCNYTTSIKSNYEKHLNTNKHKNNIIIVNENIKKFICNNCNKQLSSKQRFDNHLLCCRGVESSLECSKCHKTFNKSNTRYIHEKKCTKVKTQIIPYTNNKDSNIVNNIVNNINNGTVNNIIINNFGTENFDHLIEDPNFISFMQKCVENKAEGLCDLIIKKYFDPSHPENHNIRKLDKKDNFLQIYKNDNWNTQHYKDGLEYITIPLEATVNIFMEKLLETNKDINVNVFQHFMKEVGSILEWDLSVGYYDFSFNNKDMINDMDDKCKKSLKTKIFKLFCECIYKYTKLVHKN
jgi:hypothetical protein